MDEGTPYRPNFVPRAGTKQGRRVLNPYFRKALSSGPSSDGGLDRIHSVARDQGFSYHDARSPLDVFEGETDKDIEIMVLRHQVRILERQLNARVTYRPVDRAILAALSRLLARRRWRSFLVTPEALLRWHRELSRRKWRRWRSTRGPGRPLGTNIPIALVGAPDAGRLRKDRPGLSLKVARDAAAIAMSSPGRRIQTANAGDRKRSGKRRRQFGRREAGLRGGLVLVDDATEHVLASNDAERRGSRGHCADRCGHIEPEAAVRPVLVIVPDVVAKDCFEVVAAENERPVETLFSDGPYPPLRDRVRTRRSHRCLDHLDTFGDEHLVEAGGELRVAVSDQEPERPSVLGEISGEVPGNLGDKGGGRMIGETEDVDYAALELDDEQHIELGETDRVHDEEVGSHDALGLGGGELLPGRSTVRSGSEPVAAKYPTDRARRDADP